jgi:hypothetical protein
VGHTLFADLTSAALPNALSPPPPPPPTLRAPGTPPADDALDEFPPRAVVAHFRSTAWRCCGTVGWMDEGEGKRDAAVCRRRSPACPPGFMVVVGVMIITAVMLAQLLRPLGSNFVPFTPPATAVFGGLAVVYDRYARPLALRRLDPGHVVTLSFVIEAAPVGLGNTLLSALQAVRGLQVAQVLVVGAYRALVGLMFFGFRQLVLASSTPPSHAKDAFILHYFFFLMDEVLSGLIFLEIQAFTGAFFFVVFVSAVRTVMVRGELVGDVLQCIQEARAASQPAQVRENRWLALERSLREEAPTVRRPARRGSVAAAFATSVHDRAVDFVDSVEVGAVLVARRFSVLAPPVSRAERSRTGVELAEVRRGSDREMLATTGRSSVERGGGTWCPTLRMRTSREEAQTALDLLKRDGLLELMGTCIVLCAIVVEEVMVSGGFSRTRLLTRTFEAGVGSAVGGYVLILVMQCVAVICSWILQVVRIPADMRAALIRRAFSPTTPPSSPTTPTTSPTTPPTSPTTPQSDMVTVFNPVSAVRTEEPSPTAAPQAPVDVWAENFSDLAIASVYAVFASTSMAFWLRAQA